MFVCRDDHVAEIGWEDVISSHRLLHDWGDGRGALARSILLAKVCEKTPIVARNVFAPHGAVLFDCLLDHRPGDAADDTVRMDER